jgi:hypothetical protein
LVDHLRVVGHVGFFLALRDADSGRCGKMFKHMKFVAELLTGYLP